jgi:hypothetical protein
MKFTFKTDRERYRPNYYIIKLKRRECGQIFSHKYSGPWEISFMIYKDETNDDHNSNCKWMWKIIKSLSTVEECKVWINENIEMIMKMKIRYADE